MTTPRAGQIIRHEVLGWPGVEEAPHRFGGLEFRLGRRELGHLHGDSLADLPFPVRVREQLVRDGQAQPHHVLPESGWVSYRIAGPEAVPGAIALFRLAYERATAARVGPADGTVGDHASPDTGVESTPAGDATPQPED